MVSLISFVVGGMALFLYGMSLATDGLREAAGGRLRATLTVLTARRLTALASGVVVTFLLSSSSALATMLVDLADSGLLSLRQAVLILLGAGVGISLTVQIITFPIAAWALLIVALGLAVRAVARFRRGRALGTALIGVGLVFFGLNLVNQGVGAAASDTIRELTPWLDWPIIGLLIGAAVSAFLRTVATVGLVVVLAGNGVPLESLVPVVLGATVGTCAAPLLASLRSGARGRQVALAEFLFRLAVAVGLLFIVRPIAELAAWATASMGIETTAEGAARRSVANALFFVTAATAVVLAPLAGIVSAAVERLTSRRGASSSVPGAAAEEASEDPEEAIELTHAEVVRMAEMTRGLVNRSTRAVIANDERELERLEAADESVDALDQVLTRRLEDLRPAEIAPDALEIKTKLLYIIKALEALADVATRDLPHIGWEKSRDNVSFDDVQAREIEALLHLLDDDLGRLVTVVRGEDRTELDRAVVLERDREIDLRRLRLFDEHAARVAAGVAGVEGSTEAYLNTINALRTVHFLIADVLRVISGPPPGAPRIGSIHAGPHAS